MSAAALFLLAAVAARLLLVVRFAAAQAQSLTPTGDLAFVADPAATHDYARFAGVQKQCGDVLSSAAKFEIDPHRASSLVQELTFVRGEWRQDRGKAALMPFDGSDVVTGKSAATPAALLTFFLTHVDTARRSGMVNAVNVSAVVGIGISRNGTAPQIGRYASPVFKYWPGSSDMTMLFEGVYTESPENGGERVLCMLGTAMLPKRGEDSTFPKTPRPPVVDDDHIVLIIRYPATFTLTARAIAGEMRSTRDKNSPGYFDPVRLSSQLGAYSNYNFGAQDALVGKACTPYPFADNAIRKRVPLYKGGALCALLDRFAGDNDETFSVVPNWDCTVDPAYCAKLGPFELTHESFADVKLRMQDLRCEPHSAPDNTFSARVSALFRAILPDDATVGRRTGLSGMTLSAEGVWNSSSGQLCMIGCLGAGAVDCRYRVCLYVPAVLTITRRSIIFGTITSIDSVGASAHFPLTFEKNTHPALLWAPYAYSPVSAYKYTETDQARAFLRQSQPFNFGSVIAKSLLSYPSKAGDGSGNDTVALSNLADDLTLHVPAIPDLGLTGGLVERRFIYLEVLSIGALVGRVQSGPGSPPRRRDVVDGEVIHNVSAELTVMTMSYAGVSTYNLEGVYNSVDGRMYLVGCRDVRATGGITAESRDVVDGMDCAIEVTVEYPPTTARWLINPTAKISVVSRRNADDLLYFNSTGLMTLPILYRQQRQDILSRRGVEGVLRVVTLSLSIAAMASQLLYIKSNGAAAPFVSLVMLGVQALGYSVPLITGAEALFARMTTSDADGPPSFQIASSPLYWTIDCVVKLLVLLAFLLTLRMAQKVWRSRIRLLTRAPLEPGRVPSDKKVFLVTLAVHAAGFAVVLAVYLVGAYSRPARQEDTYMDATGRRHPVHEWATQLEEYIGLAQDFFLMPQIVGNYVWRVNCVAALKKTYYVGLTAARLLPHLYDYIRAPSMNPYFSDEYEFVNPSLDFFSAFGDIAIPVAAVVFALVVYVQQRWSYKVISKTVKSGQKKLQHLGSRVYERLPSMSSVSFEAELVAGANEAAPAAEADRRESL